MLIEDVATTWALGVGVPSRGKYWMALAEKREKILDAARKWAAVPGLGVPPAEVSEPFTVMLWGITTDKVDEWLKGSSVKPEDVTELKGFASSSRCCPGTGPGAEKPRGSRHPQGWRDHGRSIHQPFMGARLHKGEGRGHGHRWIDLSRCNCFERVRPAGGHRYRNCDQRHQDRRHLKSGWRHRYRHYSETGIVAVR